MSSLQKVEECDVTAAVVIVIINATRVIIIIIIIITGGVIVGNYATIQLRIVKAQS